jgi:hypothetical protein
MRKLFAGFLLAAILFACSQRKPLPAVNPGTPKALQEKESEFSLSKRGYDDDLIDKLYKEELGKSPALKALEDRVNSLQELRGDSLYHFEKFINQNNIYYTTANQYIERLRNEGLKVQLKTLIDSSRNAYAIRTRTHTNLISQLDASELTLNDLHVVLKLVKTLPLIERYQKDELPAVAPIEKVNREYDKTIRQLENAVKH